MNHEERLKLEIKLQNKKYAAKYLSEAHKNARQCKDNDEASNEFFVALERVLRAHRRQVTEVARRTRVTRVHIYRILKGSANPTFETLQRLLEELGFTIQFEPLEK